MKQAGRAPAAPAAMFQPLAIAVLLVAALRPCGAGNPFYQLRRGVKVHAPTGGGEVVNAVAVAQDPVQPAAAEAQAPAEAAAAPANATAAAPANATAAEPPDATAAEPADATAAEPVDATAAAPADATAAAPADATAAAPADATAAAPADATAAEPAAAPANATAAESVDATAAAPADATGAEPADATGAEPADVPVSELANATGAEPADAMAAAAAAYLDPAKEYADYLPFYPARQPETMFKMRCRIFLSELFQTSGYNATVVIKRLPKCHWDNESCEKLQDDLMQRLSSLSGPQGEALVSAYENLYGWCKTLFALMREKEIRKFKTS